MEESEKEELLGRLETLPKFDKLKFVYHYGSTAIGEGTARSDVDICIYYDEEKDRLHDLLFKISGSLPDRYDVKMFQLLPLYVKKEVFRGNLIYAEDRDFVHDLARKTYREYEDFEPRYKYILRGKVGLEVSI